MNDYTGTWIFIGNECRTWEVNDFANAARTAHSLGFDGIVPKRADGMLRWFHDLVAERQAVQDQGCGFLPFLYAYGPRFGPTQIRGECALLAELRRVCGGVVCDMEQEWNGQQEAAKQFADELSLQPGSGNLIISTWADPLEQNWQEVIRELLPIATAWWPQAYDRWLAARTGEFTALGVAVIHPTIDISNDVGPNDPLALAQGHTMLSVWEYESVCQQQELARAITALVRKERYMAAIPSGWKDDGRVLTAPNGLTVILGFRDYVLTHDWDQNNWPLEQEHAQVPLELSNLGLGAGTQQTFRETLLGWTQQRGVFEEWMGQELLTLRAKVVAAIAVSQSGSQKESPISPTASQENVSQENLKGSGDSPSGKLPANTVATDGNV